MRGVSEGRRSRLPPVSTPSFRNGETSRLRAERGGEEIGASLGEDREDVRDRGERHRPGSIGFGYDLRSVSPLRISVCIAVFEKMI